MVSFISRMLAGFAGQITRETPAMVVESGVMTGSAGLLPASFGVAIQLSSGLIVAYTGTVANVYGILLRPFPRQALTTGFGSDVPTVNQMSEILRKGYFAAVSGFGAPTINAPVFVRNDTGGHGGVIGGMEVTSDTTHSTLLPGAHWMGSADANGVAEISYNM